MPSSRSALLIYAPTARAPYLRGVLGKACSATAIASSVEWSSSGAIYRRLASERDDPKADLVFGVGPCGLEVAAREELLQPFEPSAHPGAGTGQLRLASTDNRWWTLDFSPFTIPGEPPISSLVDLESDRVRRLCLPDPARAETGTLAVVATLDQLRRSQGDSEKAWSWWERRGQRGIVVADSLDGAAQAVRRGDATHGLLMGNIGPVTASGAVWIRGLAPMPNPVALTSNAPHLEEARLVLNWLLGPEGASTMQSQGGLSAWHADQNGLRQLADDAPPLDLDWVFGEYGRTRRNWSDDFSHTPRV